jgi:hypothetical protein
VVAEEEKKVVVVRLSSDFYISLDFHCERKLGQAIETEKKQKLIPKLVLFFYILF